MTGKFERNDLSTFSKHTINALVTKILSQTNNFGDYEIVGIKACGSNGAILSAIHNSSTDIVALKLLNVRYYLINRFQIRLDTRFEIAPQYETICQAIDNSKYCIVSNNNLAMHNRPSAENKSFLREISCLRELPRCNNEVCLIDYGVLELNEICGSYNHASVIPFVVMPLIQGDPLNLDMLRSKTIQERTIEVFRLGLKLLDAIERIHKYGIVHRDLSYNNLLFDHCSEKIHIVDFGSAFLPNRSNVFDEGDERRGSRRFMSPEQFLNPSNCTFVQDYYFLGSFLFYFLTSITPYSKNRSEKTRPLDMYDCFPQNNSIDPLIHSLICDSVNSLLAYSVKYRMTELPQIYDCINSIIDRMLPDL